jgi:hypothetical protein
MRTYRSILPALFVAVLSVFTSMAWAAGKNKNPTAASDESQPLPNSQGTIASKDSLTIHQMAVQAGVRDCLPRIDQVTGFLAAGGQQGAMVFADPRLPDQGLVSLSQEIQSGQTVSYAGTSYAPDQNGYCRASYEAVTYWAAACNDVAKSAFPTFKRSAPLREYLLVLDGGPSAKVFMMSLPANRGCVTIKKEVVFQ